MTELAVEVAAVLEAFSAEQKAAAIGQARLQKIVFARQIGEGQIQFEAVIEETASATEIYDMLSRVEGATDRLKAKVDLTGHYGRILNLAGQIDMARKKAAEEEVAFRAKNAAESAGRRTAIVMTSQQEAALRQHRDGIKDCWERIEETQKAIEECQRILSGEDPFAVLADQIAARLDALRGSRTAAA